MSEEKVSPINEGFVPGEKVYAVHHSIKRTPTVRAFKVTVDGVIHHKDREEATLKTSGSSNLMSSNFYYIFRSALDLTEFVKQNLGTEING